ncbi:MAG: hypothetical protein AAGD28_18715 [Bacteroidota bacterium]
MKRSICLLFLGFSIFTSWACSCVGIHPINLASLNADQVVVAKIYPKRPFSNALELKVQSVIKGNSELTGSSILLWQDYFDCSSIPAIDTSHEFVIAFQEIEDEYLADYLGHSQELQVITDSNSYKQALDELQGRSNFVLLSCSDSYVKLKDQMRIEIARKYKKKKGRMILRKRKKNFSRKDFIDYLQKLKRI